MVGSTVKTLKQISRVFKLRIAAAMRDCRHCDNARRGRGAI